MKRTCTVLGLLNAGALVLLGCLGYWHGWGLQLAAGKVMVDLPHFDRALGAVIASVNLPAGVVAELLVLPWRAAMSPGQRVALSTGLWAVLAVVEWRMYGVAVEWARQLVRRPQ